MSNQTVASLRSQGKDITLKNAAKSLFYDESRKLYVHDDAPAKPENGSRSPSILWGDRANLHIKTPDVMKGVKKIDSRTAQQGSYTQIDEIFLFRPNVICCGYSDGVFFAELWRLNPRRLGYIWYISPEDLQFNKKANVMTGGRRDMIAQSKPAKGLIAVQVRKPIRSHLTTIYEVSLSTGLGPWVPLRFTA